MGSHRCGRVRVPASQLLDTEFSEGLLARRRLRVSYVTAGVRPRAEQDDV